MSGAGGFGAAVVGAGAAGTASQRQPRMARFTEERSELSDDGRTSQPSELGDGRNQQASELPAAGGAYQQQNAYNNGNGNGGPGRVSPTSNRRSGPPGPRNLAENF